jgi:hypothetical protein
MKDSITIACIAVIILLIMTAGCTTIKTAQDNVDAYYQLLPSQAGMVRFHTGTGSTEVLIQTQLGMRWMQIPETKIEVVPVPVQQSSSLNY